MFLTDNSALHEVIIAIEKQFITKDRIVVAVCGGSCTRKSSLVSAYLVDSFKDKCVLISQDQFQLQPLYLENVDSNYKWDHPNNFGISQCYDVLKKLKNNQTVKVPNYNFKKEEPITYKTLAPAPIIIFEGLYTNYKKLNDLTDASVYVKSPWYARMTRRVFRNTLDRYKGREASAIVESFCDSVTKAHLDFVKTQEKRSNFIAEVPFQFHRIIEHYNLKPIDYETVKKDIFFSIDCDNRVSFKITHTTSNQFEFLFFYNNNLYLKFNIESSVAQKLKRINWLDY